ncbi:MAG TPA: hypothetical protein VN790_08965 [Steroidobacteraceae bacterium]|nr:hypothetical protein [Steroidobacteraceae bacterium]
MNDQQPESSLAPEVVMALARLAGYPPLDADTAARIAVGASNAVRAVAASATVSLIDTEPAAFLAELERLAESD